MWHQVGLPVCSGWVTANPAQGARQQVGANAISDHPVAPCLGRMSAASQSAIAVQIMGAERMLSWRQCKPVRMRQR